MEEYEDISEIVSHIASDNNISEDKKLDILRLAQKLKKTKVNILITGPTGSGKSSTINALFGDHVAKVGQGVNPETMDIRKFELKSINLWDSPGLGDGVEKDSRHAKKIIALLNEKDEQGHALIDLVLVIIDVASRELGTTYELINEVVIPNIGENSNRLLVAINQCDMAMKGYNWDRIHNKPEPELTKFLDEDVIPSIQKRIEKSTGAIITPIYYSAGYKHGNEKQQPYNLSKLLLLIMENTRIEKRIVFINDINKDKNTWKKDDGLENYSERIQESLLESIRNTASEYGEIGEEIGSFFGSPGKTIGRVGGIIVGGVIGIFKALF